MINIIRNENKISMGSNNEKVKKQKIKFPDESTYEGYLKNNEFDGKRKY